MHELLLIVEILFSVLPDYQDYAYYLPDEDDTIEGQDLETGQKNLNEPYQTQWKPPPQIHHTKLSGMCVQHR